MSKKTIGIVGCGNIGGSLARYAEKNLSKHIGRINIFDTMAEEMYSLAETCSICEKVESIDELVKSSDLIIEAAHPSVVYDVVSKAIAEAKDVMVMSIGGFIGNESLLDTAREEGVRVFLPSGAIAGIDALKSAKVAGINEVMITTRKGPKSIKGVPYFEENGIDVDAITEDTVVFDGTAKEAIQHFPKNINVSALLSIAGIGAEKTRVRIIVSPAYTKNIHEVTVDSNAGKITARTENVPSPDNPKTSYLAILAAITALENYFDTVRVGT